MDRKREDFRTIYCDPGEDFGWCVGRDTKLLAGGTLKMWEAVDDILAAVSNPSDPSISMNSPEYAREGVEPEEMLGPIGRIVCEDWRLYPWVIKTGALDYDQCRTARAIGALKLICRMHDIPLVLQGADIKQAAKAAGAEELYYRPVNENRHTNDAIQHFVFFTNVELLSVPLITTGATA